MTEIYKIVNGIAPPIMNFLFEFQSNEFNIKLWNQNNYVQSATLRAKLPSEYKFAASLEEFKVKIKKWKCDTCPCRLCKDLGFVS